MTIEQSFRDDKFGGFNMAHIQLQHADHIEHLLLAMAVATLRCHELGEYVLQQGEATRCLIDPGPTRELSLFQLGLRWLKRILAVAVQFCPISELGCLISNFNPFALISPIRKCVRVSEQ